MNSPHSDSDAFGPPKASQTVADSIAVDVPRNGLHALNKLRRYGGQAVIVSDAEILAAQRTLAAGSGLFAEPSSSAAFAGWLKVRGRLGADENCVVLITGTGLKDVNAAAQGLGLKT